MPTLSKYVPMSVGRRREPAEKCQCLVLRLDRRCEIDLALRGHAGAAAIPGRPSCRHSDYSAVQRAKARPVWSVKGVDCSGTLSARRVDILCCDLFE